MTLCRYCNNSGEILRVIYMGFPMNLCNNDECLNLSGFWSFVPVIAPVSDGEGYAFMVYEGSYFVAIWHWLFGDED